MSRLCDYSKFDHLDDASSSSEDDHDDRKSFRSTYEQQQENSASSSSERQQHQQQQQQQQQHIQQLYGDVGTKLKMTKKGSTEGRYVFEHNGQKVYEWDQSLEEVNLYIDAPPGVNSASQIVCDISPTRLTLGLRGSDRNYIDERTYGKVIVSESSWCLDPTERVINVVLVKAHRGETWEAALFGRRGASSGEQETVDPATKERIKKDLMIERFQEENPGFDFRGAEFNGMVPDPRTFMGGVKYR